MQSLSQYPPVPPLPPVLRAMKNWVLGLQSYFREMEQWNEAEQNRLIIAREISKMDEPTEPTRGGVSSLRPLSYWISLFKSMEDQRRVM